MSYHKLLESQIKKLLPETLQQQPEIATFLNTINNSYNAYDRDKELSERAFKISEEEFEEINYTLKQEAQIKQQSIHKLKETIDEVTGGETKDESDDILSIAHYLDEQIKKRRNAEKIFSSYIRNIHSGILLKDEYGTIIFINQYFCDLFGIKQLPDELRGTDFHDTAEKLKDYFKDPELYTAKTQQYLEQKEYVNSEILELKDGRIIDRSYIPIFVEQEYQGHLWEYKDISEQYKIEDAIKKSEETNRLILNSSLDGIVIADESGNIIFWNPMAEKIFGWKEAETKNQILVEFIIPPAKRLKYKKILSDYIETGEGPIFNKALEITAINKDNQEFPIEISIIPIEQATGKVFCGFIRDISEREKAKEKIKSSEKMLADSQQIAHIGSWETDLITGKVYWSDELYRIRGLKPQEQEASTELLYKCIHPDDREMVRAIAERAPNEQQTYNIFYRIILPNGKIRIQHDIGELVLDKNNTIIKIRGTGQDVTEQKNIEQEIIHQKRFTEDILNNIPADIAVFDQEHNYLFINNHGVKDDTLRKWLIGKNDFDYYQAKGIDDSIAVKRREVFNTVVKNKNTIEWVDEHNNKDGTKQFILRKFYPHFEEEALKFVIGYGIDITGPKKMEQELQVAYDEKNEILESIGDGFFTVDENWIVSYWNNQAEKIMGIGKEAIVGKKLWDIFTDAVNTPFHTFWSKALKEKSIQQFEAFYEPINTWFEVSAYPSPNGISVYFKDITERKLYEIQMKKLNDDLISQAKKLEISNKELEQFAYAASHDLQEPLRMITSFLSQLENKYSSIIDEKGKQYIFFAVDGAKRMRQIILDLLEFSRVGRTEHNLEEINLNELVEDIKTLLKKQIQEKQAVIEYGDLPNIKSFNSPLRQIFQNLIGNSLKYQTAGIKPEIKIIFEDKKTHWQFAVKDNGIGIAPEYFDKIFVIFQRLHNKDEYSGTGIGLAITKKIIDNIGGKIWLESKEGEGCTFFFTIPKNKLK